MPVIFFAFLVGSFVVGIAFGTSLALVWQLLTFVSILWWLNSDSVRRMEIAGIVPMMLGVVFIAGMVIGDVSYLVQTDTIGDFNLTNPFIVKDK